jgi:hypothetical protein
LSLEGLDHRRGLSPSITSRWRWAVIVDRLCGELRLKNGQTQTAEAGFREAIALAISTGAKAWELRATMSLAWLLAN